MIYYVTHYRHPTKKIQKYRTLSLTPVHARLRETYGGRTLRFDTEVEWPFGVYSEVIAEVKHESH